MIRRVVLIAAGLVLASGAFARELTSSYVITAAANKAGWLGTDWHTDLTLYNPQKKVLRVILQFLPTGQDNSGSQGVPTADPIDLQPWETLNLWDVLGPHGFAARGQTGALLVYADNAANDCEHAGTGGCDFAAFARNYTLNPFGSGEFGQDFAGFPASLGVDGSVIAYLPQLMDNADFITSIGAASWTNDWVTVRVDLQDTAGNIVHSYTSVLPPYGHWQDRIPVGLEGGTAAVYIVNGPSDAMVYPYATVRSAITGDPTTIEAQITAVGLSNQAKTLARGALRRPPTALRAPTFSLQELRQRPQTH